MRIRRRRPGSSGRRFAGGISIDGDQVTIVVCAGRGAADAGALRFDRETLAGDLPQAIAEAEELLAYEDRDAGIDWIITIGGGDVLHEVIAVPPQVRAFHDVRLEACLAGTSWGNTDAVEAAGYRLGHVFDRDRCVVGVAPVATLAAFHDGLGVEVKVTSAAAALLELVRTVDPELTRPGGRAALALLCQTESVAACVVENGEVRILHQASLVGYLREAAAESPPVGPLVSEPVEFEFGGYAGTQPAARAVTREADPGADVESGAYQTAVMRVVQDLLALYREQYGTSVPFPQAILLTGEATTRHAVRAFMARYLASQFTVEELDSALVVRIDDLDVARRFASLQNLYGGALAALASCLGGNTLELTVEPGESADVDSTARSTRRPIAQTGVRRRTIATGVLVAIVVSCAAVGLRWWLLAGEESTLSAQVETETNRQAQLRALTEERKRVEARLEHTRGLLAALESLRTRQKLPPELLATLAARLPDGAQLDEVSFAGGIVTIVGNADDKEKGTLLALALERMHDTFADVTPQTDTKVVKAEDDATGQEAERASYTFTITARYIRNAPAAAESRVLGAGREP